MKFHAVPYASMQTFPPTNGVGRGQGYQTAGTPSGMSSNFLISEVTVNWNGYLFVNVSMYTSYASVAYFDREMIHSAGWYLNLIL